MPKRERENSQNLLRIGFLWGDKSSCKINEGITINKVTRPAYFLVIDGATNPPPLTLSRAISAKVAL
jgi:hypothetical protein